MIPQRIIDDIRDRSDIVRIIGSFLELKKAGNNFKALCPFHSEKTPSFMVSPEKQIYHCFGCGKGGNAFHFLMEYEGVGFIEAVRKLGKELGIEVERYIVGGERRERLEPYYRAVDFAVSYYGRMLKEAPGSEKARGYLKKREIDDELIERFGIGYSPAGWDNFYRTAMKEDLPRDTLIELNLIMRSRGGSGYRDYFRNRVIFPVETLSNRAVGLAGRVLDESEPKYLNTTESPVYSKGRILYGFNHSRDQIRKSKTVLLVEGYMDYLMLWKKGFHNLCAVCGTSLTGDQTRLLARYANRVYIINDGDAAGIRAAVRAADMLLTESVEVQIVVLPEGEDPDSFVRNRGAEALQDLMQNAPSYFNFLREEAERGRRTTERKDRIIKHLLETVFRIEDRIRKELYLQEISSLFDIPVETLRLGLKERKRPRGKEVPAIAAENRRQRFQKLLFRVGLEEARYARMILDGLIEEDLQGVLFRNYYKALDSALKNHIDITSSKFAGSIEDPELSRLVSEIALMQMPPGPVEQFLADTLVWLRKAALKEELALMKGRLRELQADAAGNVSSEEMEIAETYRKVSRELRKLGPKEENPFG